MGVNWNDSVQRSVRSESVTEKREIVPANHCNYIGMFRVLRGLFDSFEIFSFINKIIEIIYNYK